MLTIIPKHQLLVNKLDSIITNICDYCVDKFSTIYAIIVCLFWSLMPIFIHSTENVVFYISGGVIQLIALPEILYRDKRGTEKAEKRAEADHLAIQAEFKMLKTLLNEVHVLVREAHTTHKEVLKLFPKKD